MLNPDINPDPAPVATQPNPGPLNVISILPIDSQLDHGLADSDTCLQAWLRADGGPMTLLKGFAAGTPGFGPVEGKYGALAVVKALKLPGAPAQRGQATALLEGARQV